MDGRRRSALAHFGMVLHVALDYYKQQQTHLCHLSSQGQVDQAKLLVFYTAHGPRSAIILSRSEPPFREEDTKRLGRIQRALPRTRRG